MSVCVRVSHTRLDVHNSAKEEERLKAADKHIMMILCVVDLKASGLSNHWIVKHKTEPGGRKTHCKSGLQTNASCMHRVVMSAYVYVYLHFRIIKALRELSLKLWGNG